MFKILCEQYKMDAVLPESAGVSDGVMVLQVACVSGLPIGTPQGPQIIPIPTAVVQIAMDAAERQILRDLLDAYDAAGEDAGEAQPQGVPARRCGRLQQHPSHTYTQLDVAVWCDGGSVLTDAGGVSEATDELPAPTGLIECTCPDWEPGVRHRQDCPVAVAAEQEALEAGYASEAEAMAEAEAQFAEQQALDAEAGAAMDAGPDF